MSRVSKQCGAAETPAGQLAPPELSRQTLDNDGFAFIPNFVRPEEREMRDELREDIRRGSSKSKL